MNEFMLIFRHEDGNKVAKPEQIKVWMKQTMDWIGGIAALNRTYALSKANGSLEAIAEAEKLQLTNNHFYFTLLGELYKNIDANKAKLNFRKALSLAKTRRTSRRSKRKSIGFNNRETE